MILIKQQEELAKYGQMPLTSLKAWQQRQVNEGLRIGALMNVTKQFDTFEGAAQSAGKLNAILGGGVVNSMDASERYEEERVQTSHTINVTFRKEL